MTEIVSTIERESLDKMIELFNSSDTVLQDERNVIKQIDFEGNSYVIKSFKKPHFINSIVYKFFRPTKAKRSYEFSTQLQNLAIEVPKPIAYRVNSTFFQIKDSYYVSEFLDNAFEYRVLLKNKEFPDRENILRQFTRFTFDLQQKKVFFKDHSPGNTLIRKTDDGNYHFYLIDVNRMKFDVEFDLDKRLKNFENLSAPDDVIQIMSDEYAKLIGMDKDIIYQKISFYAQDARQKRDKRDKRKKSIKKLLGINKE